MISFLISMGIRVLPFLKSWKGAMIGLIVAAVISTGWYVYSLNGKITELKVDKALVTRWYSDCHEINIKNQDEMLTLKGANESLSTAITISHDAMLRSAENAAEKELSSKLMLDDTLDQMKELQNANPSCKALSELDIGAVCPLSVERLRQHASGADDSVRND
jgi:hypothetical protein